MPQLDSFYFFGESVITLVLLYTVIYFYLFWFSKQNFEYWVVSARLNYYFEKQVVYLVFLQTTLISQLVKSLKIFYEESKSLDFWNRNLHVYGAIE